jgi:hypothetical protein
MNVVCNTGLQKLRLVMPGLVPGIHVLTFRIAPRTWMAGTSPAMTNGQRVDASEGWYDPIAARSRDNQARSNLPGFETIRSDRCYVGSSFFTRRANFENRFR